MNKKITSSALAALMIAGSTSFSALAAMSNGTVVIGTKAFDLAYANDPKNAEEITNAIVAGGAVYVKDFEGNWIDNTSGKNVEASVIPAVVYKNAEKETNIAAGDKDAVTSAVTVSAISANSLKAVFNQAPADTSKVTFTVLRGTIPVVVTATWNATKTEATVVSSTNLPEGSYAVKVMNDTTDLGTSTITISQQKVAKIEITSTKLGVVNATATIPQTGYASYRILDQYGNDITNSALANNVQFQTGVGSPTASKGLLKIQPSTGLNLMSFTSGIVITANDTSTGVSASATLVATSQVGTLSDISLSALTNADNKVLTAGNTTDLFYAGFTATDISGNPTTNYTLMKQGLILQTGDTLTTSSPYVTATLVQDPKDSTKGVIEVKANSTNISMDMPVIITAMTWTGKTSQISTTLKKQASVATFTLMSPAEDIASGESKIIPFTAVDQNGVALTKYDDLIGTPTNPLVTFTNLIPIKNVDGTLSLKNVAVTNGSTTSVPQVLTAMVSGSATGYSTITVNIQKAVKAEQLVIDSETLVGIMQVGAVQNIDFGYDAGGLSVKDQFGRTIDMSNGSGTLKVVPTVTSGTAYVTALGNSYAGFQTSITASAQGTSTVKFTLIDTADGHAGSVSDPHTVIDEKLVTLTVIANNDIKGYMMDSVDAPIYTSATSGAITVADLTGSAKEYKANPSVFGKTSSGAKVKLAQTGANATLITGAYVDSSDFIVAYDAATGEFDSTKIYAKKFADPAKTGSDCKLTVTLQDYKGDTQSVTTAVKSTTVAPVASTIAVSVDTDPSAGKLSSGISVDGDTITIDRTVQTANSDLYVDGLVSGNYISMFGTADGTVAPTGSRAKIYLYAKDQYGKKAMTLAQIRLISATNTLTGATSNAVTISNTGVLSGTLLTGYTYKITGVTTSGLVKTFEIVVK